MELVAAIIELGVAGTYQQLHGVAQSAVGADDRFTLKRRFALNDGVEPAPGTLWNFDTDSENWLITGEVTHNTVGTLTVAHNIPYVEYYSPPLADLQAEFDGALYRYVQVRLRKVAGTVINWEGFMLWTTADHTWSDSYRNDVPMSVALEAGEWVTLTWDMHNPTFGGEDWKNNTIKQIRFDLSSDIGPVFEIDWVVIGRRASDVVVQLQEGTRIINRYGKLLSADDIAPGTSMMVDGVLDSAAEPEVLYAALSVVDTDVIRLTRISGILGDNPDGSCGFTVMSDSGDRGIRYDANTRAYAVSASGSEEVSVAALPSGLAADVFGAEANDGCLLRDRPC
jgi:hypothetical protein